MLYTKVAFVFFMFFFFLFIISEWHGVSKAWIRFSGILTGLKIRDISCLHLWVASSSMQLDLTGKYLNSGWNTDSRYLFISIYLFILTNYSSGLWKTVFDWYRELSKGALLLNNSVNLWRLSQLFVIVNPWKTHHSTVTCQYVIKLTGYWALLINVVKATFQCLMVENVLGLFTEHFGTIVGGFLCDRKDELKWTELNLSIDDEN